MRWGLRRDRTHLVGNSGDDVSSNCGLNSGPIVGVGPYHIGAAFFEIKKFFEQLATVFGRRFSNGIAAIVIIALVKLPGVDCRWVWYSIVPCRFGIVTLSTALFARVTPAFGMVGAAAPDEDLKFARRPYD